MQKTSLISKFFITTTLVLLGTNVFFIDKSTKTQQKAEMDLISLSRYYSKAIDIAVEESCKYTIQYLCNAEVDCAKKPIEELINYCERTH